MLHEPKGRWNDPFKAIVHSGPCPFAMIEDTRHSCSVSWQWHAMAPYVLSTPAKMKGERGLGFEWWTLFYDVLLESCDTIEGLIKTLFLLFVLHGICNMIYDVSISTLLIISNIALTICLHILTHSGQVMSSCFFFCGEICGEFLARPTTTSCGILSWFRRQMRLQRLSRWTWGAPWGLLHAGAVPGGSLLKGSLNTSLPIFALKKFLEQDRSNNIK